MSGIASTRASNGLPPTTIPATPVVNLIGGTPASLMGTLTSTTTSASAQTALTLSGVSGVVEYCSLSNGSGVTLTATLLRIVIDGTEVYNETGSIVNLRAKNAIGAFGISTNPAIAALAKQPFNTSLLIEFASDGTNLGTCNFRYYLT